MRIKLKRVYETPAASDGYRILVDRIWPRGVTKEKASVSLWLKTIAPTTELRKWFGHTPERWKEFHRRYLKELKTRSDELELLRTTLKKEKTITLVYSAKDAEHNQAVVIREYFEKNLRMNKN